MIYAGVGKLVQAFALDVLHPHPKFLGNLNWYVQDGNLPESKNSKVYGSTYKYKSGTHTVFTKFDPQHFKNSTEIAIAETILHEAVHAYLIAYYRSDLHNGLLGKFREKFSVLFELYSENQGKKHGMEKSQHMYMAKKYVDKITKALQQFGQEMGLTLDYQYYHDLAWSGLRRTKYFDNLSEEEQHRIINRNIIERTGRNMSGEYQNQKGKPSSC